MNAVNTGFRKRLWLPEMEGATARWYSKQRGTPSQIAAWKKQATLLTAGLPDGAAILEVAPGPGYLAIEMARPGRFQVTGLDISHTMVEIARENARAASVPVDFLHGDASAMPFPAGAFDFIICQAAFKNFREPVTALNEMHRSLKKGGVALIQDMNKAATGADIAREVSEQGLGALNAFITRRILSNLRRRAYTPARFKELVAASAFRTCDVETEGIGLEVRLVRRDEPPAGRA